MTIRNGYGKSYIYFLPLHPVLSKGVSHAHLPAVWPGFESWRRRHMWVECVVGSLLCSEKFFSGHSGGAIHSTKISGNFGPKLNGSVRSNRKSFEKTGPPFEVVLFSRSDRSEFWLNGSRPGFSLSALKTNTFKLQFDLERTNTFQRALKNS